MLKDADIFSVFGEHDGADGVFCPYRIGFKLWWSRRRSRPTEPPEPQPSVPMTDGGSALLKLAVVTESFTVARLVMMAMRSIRMRA